MEKIITPKVKICGLTHCREAEYLNEAKADYAGFVFYENSKRNVTIEMALEIGKYLEGSIKKVVVTVSPDRDLAEKIRLAGFDLLQVHGELKPEVVKIGLPIWRAVNIKENTRLDQFFEMETNVAEAVVGYVADGAGYGGGKPFDWEGAGDRIKKRTAGRDLILAGGLDAQNVKEGIRFFSPQVVDVSSSVEDETGKNREKILEFVKQVRK